jgi:hypothetical protein
VCLLDVIINQLHATMLLEKPCTEISAWGGGDDKEWLG